MAIRMRTIRKVSFPNHTEVASKITPRNRLLKNEHNSLLCRLHEVSVAEAVLLRGQTQLIQSWNQIPPSLTGNDVTARVLHTFPSCGSEVAKKTKPCWTNPKKASNTAWCSLPCSWIENQGKMMSQQASSRDR